MEQLLCIFEEQNQAVFDMRHPIPAEYEPILQRLHAALSDEEVRHARLAQEELLYEFASREKALEIAKNIAEEEINQKRAAILNLKNKGMDITEIASIFGISVEKLEDYLS